MLKMTWGRFRHNLFVANMVLLVVDGESDMRTIMLQYGVALEKFLQSEGLGLR